MSTAPGRLRAPGPPPATPVMPSGVGVYRPFLDGLRAVAVYLVVVFHAGSDRFSGGFVGVDVFFVLSGFLVTQLLLRDLTGTGSVSFRRFYARRFRRLLPAAFVVLVVTALVFSALASPVEVNDATDGFRASFLYSANWYFVAQSSDYFGADLATNPVLHFWSLAVEEQFYLAWPLLLAGLWALTRRFGTRRDHALIAVVVTAAVASALWAWSLRTSDPNRAYYGTDTRAYQLLAGALVALAPGLLAPLRAHRRAARTLGPVALAALAVTASSWVDLDAIERGIAVTAITVAALAALETASGGIAQRVLSLEPVVELGKISYGTYLWHWPVIIVLTREFDLAPITTIALTTLVATALASLSYQLLEHPIRISTLLDRHRNPVIATGLALSITAALVIIPAITTTTPTTATAEPVTTGFTPVPDGIDYTAIRNDFPDLTNCYAKPATDCTLVQGTGPHLLLLGDSTAAMLIPTFTTLARARDLTLSVSTLGGCPWQQDLYSTPLEIEGRTLSDVATCQRVKDDAYDRVIPALAPDLVVVVSLGYEADIPGFRGFLGYLGPDREGIGRGTPELDRWLESSTRASLDRLLEGGRGVAMVESTPLDPDLANPVSCLSGASVLEECRYVTAVDATRLEQLYRRLDRGDDRIWSLDLDRLVCPFRPICDPIVDGEVVRSDWSHLTSGFARSLAPAVGELLAENGAIP